jgi:hypothetical protein
VDRGQPRSLRGCAPCKGQGHQRYVRLVPLRTKRAWTRPAEGELLHEDVYKPTQHVKSLSLLIRGQLDWHPV